MTVLGDKLRDAAELADKEGERWSGVVVLCTPFDQLIQWSEMPRDNESLTQEVLARGLLETVLTPPIDLSDVEQEIRSALGRV